MAARKNLTQIQKTRDKIQTSQLINRLESHILGNVDMSATQVSAALGLIRKTLPDLKVTEVTGDGGGPVQVQNVAVKFIDSED